MLSFFARWGLTAAFAVSTLLLGLNQLADREPGPSPDRTIAGWTAAMADHNFGVVCSYESKSYSGPNCSFNYTGMMGQAALFGSDVTRGLHVVADSRRDLSDTKVTYKVAGRELNGQPTVTVTRQPDGEWRVSGIK